MSQRRPLTVLQNGCAARRKVQRTYGRKSKAPGAVVSKDFFTMSDDIENQMGRISISDTKESCDEDSQRTVVPVKGRGRTTRQLKATSEGSKTIKGHLVTSSEKFKSPQHDKVTKDQQAISTFVKDHSDRDVLSFRGYGNAINEKYKVDKIGEGSYSSVFALIPKDAEELRAPQGRRSTILKLMPVLLPSQDDTDDGMTALNHIASELQTMKVMDAIHGFIRYRGVLIVKGSWPCNFIEAFRKYSVTHRSKAINKDPDDAYNSNQYYALVEMENAGAEINEIARPSDFQMYDIFWSTCIHLANAESLVQFEHRDLHVSNVCIKPADPDNNEMNIDVDTVYDMRQKPDTILGLSNISVTLIDYTFSRVSILPDTNAPPKTNFRDFLIDADEYDRMVEERGKERLATSGRAFEESTQSLAYAKAAKCVGLTHDRAEGEGRLFHADTNDSVAQWERHVPQTNVCWLAYLIACLLQRAGKIAKTKYVASSSDVAKELQDEIRGKLVALKECLMENDINSMPKSAADVVRIGVEKGWLSKEDIAAFKARLEKDS